MTRDELTRFEIDRDIGRLNARGRISALGLVCCAVALVRLADPTSDNTAE